jgi:hypothetical protein
MSGASAAPLQVEPESVLMITLDSCRYDTFVTALAPSLKGVGAEIHAAQAPSHFTYGSHAAMFVGFTPGIAGLHRPYVNPKFAKFFRIANHGRLAFGPAAFELEGRNIIEGFGAQGYRTIGSGALSWFDPATPMGQSLTSDFEHFFYPGNIWSIRRQAAWLDAQLDEATSIPVFAFLNVGETHVPYWHEGAAWSPADNPCIPFQAVDRGAECAKRQRACLEFVDAALSGLLSRFAEATIIVTADHGECWGEDGLWEHAISHEATLTVPLVFRVAHHINARRSERHFCEAQAAALARGSDMTPSENTRPDAGCVQSLTLDSVLTMRPGLELIPMDEDAVIHDPVAESYHWLGVSGRGIVALIDGKRSIAQIVGELMLAYEVDAQTCREDVLAFLATLRAQDLLRAADETAP